MATTQNELQKAIIQALAQAPQIAIKQLKKDRPQDKAKIAAISKAIGIDLTDPTDKATKTP